MLHIYDALFWVSSYFRSTGFRSYRSSFYRSPISSYKSHNSSEFSFLEFFLYYSVFMIVGYSIVMLIALLINFLERKKLDIEINSYWSKIEEEKRKRAHQVKRLQELKQERLQNKHSKKKKK